MSPHLTDAEIAEITEPLTQGAARCRFIEREFRIKVRRKRNGQPLVGRAEFDGRIDIQAPAGSATRHRWQRHIPAGLEERQGLRRAGMIRF